VRTPGLAMTTRIHLVEAGELMDQQLGLLWQCPPFYHSTSLSASLWAIEIADNFHGTFHLHMPPPNNR
jgi:hypothetical protein